MSIWTIADYIEQIPYIVPFAAVLIIGIISVQFLPVVVGLAETKAVRLATYAAAALIGGIYFLFSLIYLLVPTYASHVEPAIAIAAEMLVRGEPVYPAWDSGEGLYGMIYGPLLYFIHASILYFSETVFATKVAGVLAIWLALLLMWKEARGFTGSSPICFFALGAIVVFFWIFSHHTFWNRPEPFLILLSGAAMASLHLAPYRAAFAVALFAGLAIGLKLFAGLFLAPMLLLLLVRQKTIAAMLPMAVFMGVIIVIVALLPFLHPSVGLPEYISYMEITARHGLSWGLFVENLERLIIVLFPVLAVYHFVRPKLSGELIWLALSLLVSMGLVAIIGSKNGAGPHHLLPFVPVVLSLACRIAAADARPDDHRISRTAAARYLFLLYFISLGPFAMIGTLDMYSTFARTQSKQTLANELATIHSAYPTAEMGTSNNARFSDTFLRVPHVLQGGPVTFDVPFFLDLDQIGEGAPEAEHIVETCAVREWILPSDGEPFSLVRLESIPGPDGFASEDYVFTEQFRTTFHENYRLVFEGESFNVWACRES